MSTRLVSEAFSLDRPSLALRDLSFIRIVVILARHALLLLAAGARLVGICVCVCAIVGHVLCTTCAWKSLRRIMEVMLWAKVAGHIATVVIGNV